MNWAELMFKINLMLSGCFDHRYDDDYDDDLFEGRVNQIGCICLTFLLYVSSNEFSNCLI